MGEGLTFPSVIRAWHRPVAKGAELLKGSWTPRGEGGEGREPVPPPGAPRAAAGGQADGAGGDTGRGGALTAALLRTQLAGGVPALARPLAATAPGLGGVESFGHRTRPGLKMGEAEAPPRVCGVMPRQALEGSSAMPGSEPGPENRLPDPASGHSGPHRLLTVVIGSEMAT